MTLTVIFGGRQSILTNHESRFIRFKHIGNNNYLRPLTNHDKNIFTNHGTLQTNLTLAIYIYSDSRKLTSDVWRSIKGIPALTNTNTKVLF